LGCLEGPDHAKADQFEESEEGDDNLGSAGGGVEEFRETEVPALAGGGEQRLDLFTDAPFVLEDLARIAGALLEALEHGVDRGEEIKDRGLRTPRFGFLGQFDAPGDAREGVFGLDLELLKAHGGVLEFSVLDEAADEFPARV